MSDHDHDHGSHAHSAPAHDEHGGEHEYHSHGKLYASIFAVLCVFTLMSIMADLIHIPSKIVLIAVVLGVAVCKALCVMMVFMHLKFERAWKYMLLAPTLILACTIPLSLTPDVLFKYYTADTVQAEEDAWKKAEGIDYVEDDAHGSGGHGGHGEQKESDH